MSAPHILLAIRDERDYAAALSELDDLALSEPGTPPGRRFDELVHLIDEYEARRSGYVLLPRGRRQAGEPRAHVARAANR